MASTVATTISGDDIFFNFIELPFGEIGNNEDLVRMLRNGELQGVVIKDVFTSEEIEAIKSVLAVLTEEQVVITPSGKLFPAPFAIITDSGERLSTYYDKLNKLYEAKEKYSSIKHTFEKLDNFFKKIAPSFSVKIPLIKLKNAAVSAGTFRIFLPNQGGLHVHCGNLFQAQSEYYYSLINKNIDKNNQLSYFLVIQQPERGGELTIYDMLWKDVKSKKTPEENESVIDDNGNTIYLKDVRNFSIKPLPGDILVFNGGPIWHRVENVGGSIPRITLGGFLNFSNDGKELYYWS